jgi:hypothetical protein
MPAVCRSSRAPKGGAWFLLAFMLLVIFSPLIPVIVDSLKNAKPTEKPVKIFYSKWGPLITRGK